MTQQTMMAKQMIDMQRTTFNGMIGSMIMLWDQTLSMIDLAVWMPDEGKKAVKQWAEMNKQGCENLKNAADAGYANLEKFFRTEA